MPGRVDPCGQHSSRFLDQPCKEPYCKYSQLTLEGKEEKGSLRRASRESLDRGGIQLHFRLPPRAVKLRLDLRMHSGFRFPHPMISRKLCLEQSRRSLSTRQQQTQRAPSNSSATGILSTDMVIRSITSHSAGPPICESPPQVWKNAGRNGLCGSGENSSIIERSNSEGLPAAYEQSSSPSSN